MSRIPEHVDKYINDELEDAQINDFTGCLQKAFRTFAEMTRGREESIYAPGEIRRFLHEYFIKDRRISDGLMDQLMIVKQLFVGGGRQHITRAELYLAVEVLEDLRKESLRLKPHMKYLNPRLARKQDPRTLGHNLRLANEAVGAAIQTFTARLRDDRPAYPFQDLEALFTEIRGFVGWETHFVDSIPVKAWVSLMRIFRELTLAPPESEREVIRPKDWTPLLQNASRWYLGFLEYEVGIKSQPLFYGIGLQNLVQLAQDVFALIEASISRQPGMTITFAQLSRLTQAFSDVHWLPNGIRVVSVQQALEATFTRVFGDPDREPSKRHSEGVNLMSFQRL
ncbi:MAG TPA: hypothetical protein PKC28_15460, partial [Bdellovibrionales bacterium]|nr:hypothetical protein [Bdellovibrionales bacterium]